MLKQIKIATTALVSGLAIVGMANIASAQTGGEGGVAGAAVFTANRNGNITGGAVAGAIGRIHAITNAYIDGDQAGAFAIGTSLPVVEVEGSDGNLELFTTDFDTNIVNATNINDGLIDLIRTQTRTQLDSTLEVGNGVNPRGGGGNDVFFSNNFFAGVE